MTKTDDVLLELSRTFAAYLESVFRFQYKDKTYSLIDNYVASPCMKCDVCGNYPIFEVSCIESDGGERLRVGSKCIDCLTGRNVSGWFRGFRRKREGIMENRRYIDQLSPILDAHDRNDLSFKIPDGDVEQLRIMFEQMCNGLNPTKMQEQIAECYINRKANV